MDDWKNIPASWPPKKAVVEIRVKAPEGSMIRYYVMHARRDVCQWITTTGRRLTDDQVTGWRPIQY